MAWKLQRKKMPAPPAPEPATGNPRPADDLAPGEGRPGEAPQPSPAPRSSYQLPDGTVVEESAAMGRTLTIPATPAQRDIGDAVFWPGRR
jgi:hypothetical protein